MTDRVIAGVPASDVAADPLPIRDDGAPDLSGHLPPASPTRPWRLFDRLVVVAFCVGLLVPGLLLAARVRPATIENRPLLKPPATTLASLLDTGWFAAVDRYLADNVAVRPYAVRVRGEVYWLLGGTGNPDVVRGVAPWLFTIEEIQPRCDHGPADNAAGLDRAHAAFTAAGQEFRFIVAPDKHGIYPEKVDPAMPYGPGCTDLARPAMRAAIDARPAFAIDGWAAVLGARAADPDGPLLYYTQDTHWTAHGALPAIRDLIRSLGPNLWSDADVVPGPPRPVSMELARQMGLIRRAIVPTILVRPGVSLTRTDVDLPVATNNARAVFRFTASGDRPLLPGRTVIVYDSFFGLQMQAIAPFFAESIWIHQGDLHNHPELGTRIGRADRVILERVERALYFTTIDELLAPLVRGAG
jgi:hypothetical protein